MSPAYVRHQIRKKFERNRDVTDPRAIEVLLHKSRLDYQETINIWKMPDHVTGLLLNDKPTAQKSFLQKFYEGTYNDLFHSTIAKPYATCFTFQVEMERLSCQLLLASYKYRVSDEYKALLRMNNITSVSSTPPDSNEVNIHLVQKDIH